MHGEQSIAVTPEMTMGAGQHLAQVVEHELLHSVLCLLDRMPSALMERSQRARGRSAERSIRAGTVRGCRCARKVLSYVGIRGVGSQGTKSKTICGAAATLSVRVM